MSFHRTQYLELSSKVTRQLCFELLTWGTEREERCEKVAGETLWNTVFLSYFCPHRAQGLIRPPPCALERRAWPEGEGGWQFLEVVSSQSLELYSQRLADNNLVGMLSTEQARWSSVILSNLTLFCFVGSEHFSKELVG